jgi:hypothetical protein
MTKIAAAAGGDWLTLSSYSRKRLLGRDVEN